MHEHPTYNILDKIGEGPWTEVYKAWDNGLLQREVAIKMLKEEFRNTPHLRDQLLERVRAMSDIRGDRLLPVLGFDGQHNWVVLEQADGSIQQRIHEGKIPVTEVQSILAQSLEALEALHSRNRLHGQIKPSNILTYTSGHIKLTDPGALINGDLQHVPGGAKYLAPELADPNRWGNAKLEPQLDLYTLGFCTLEMLAGPEFDGLFPGMKGGGADRESLWWQWHASEADPAKLIHKLVPSSAKALRAALESMLKKKVSERARSARDVLNILGDSAIPEVLRQPTGAAPPPVMPAAGEAIVDQRDRHSSIPLPGGAAAATAAASAKSAAVVKPAARSTSIPVAGKSSSASKTPRKPRSAWRLLRNFILTLGVLLLLGITVLAGLAMRHKPLGPREITVVSNPPGAVIVVDGQELTGHGTPRSGKFYPGKTYSIGVKRDGYVTPEPQTIDIANNLPAGDELVFELSKPREKITITSTPAGAAILVNGKPLEGAVTPFTREFERGKSYDISVALKGFLTPPAQKLDLLAAQKPKGNLTFPLTAEPPPKQKITIKSDPPGAVVTVDGQPVKGATTPLVRDFEPGKTYDIGVSLEGYAPQTGKLDLKRPLPSGELVLALKKLPPPPPTMLRYTIKSDPPGAAVTINGQRVERAVTPYSRDLEPGKSYEIGVDMKGYIAQTRKIQPVATAPGRDVLFTLERKPPQKITIKSDPPGATVVINGQPVDETTTPATQEFDRLAVYGVSVTLEGYFVPEIQKVDLENKLPPGGELTFALRRDPTKLTAVGLKAGDEWAANGLKMEFCWCPPGKFTMGSPADEPERRTNEGPVEVTLTRGFWLGKYEVREDEWNQIIKAAGQSERIGIPKGNMTFAEAQQFCAKLTQQERDAGRLSAQWTYVLPTEAQWEYACRANTQTATAFGNKLSSLQANFDGTKPYNGASAGVNKDAKTRTGTYLANNWGLYDMHGNVWELCRDSFTKQLPGGIDPLVERPGLAPVKRGGCFFSFGENCRSAYREDVTEERPEIGIRVAIVQSPSSPGKQAKAPDAVAPDLPFTFTAPAEWKKAANDKLAVATYEVETDPKTKVMVTITPSGGDLLTNVNRWRNQVGLPPATAQQAVKDAQEVQIDGHLGRYLRLVGAEKTTLGMIIDKDETTWFFKLSGDKNLAERERKRFETFVTSLKFK